MKIHKPTKDEIKSASDFFDEIQPIFIKYSEPIICGVFSDLIAQMCINEGFGLKEYLNYCEFTYKNCLDFVEKEKTHQIDKKSEEV